jgi:hypothetical protein
MNHIALSIGMGSAGGRICPGIGRAVDVIGENIESSSSTPLNPCGTGFRMSRWSGTKGLERSDKN